MPRQYPRAGFEFDLDAFKPSSRPGEILLNDFDLTVDRHGTHATYRVTGDIDTLKTLAEFMASGEAGRCLSVRLTENMMKQPTFTQKKCQWCTAGVGRVLALFVVEPGGQTTNLGAVCKQCAEQISMLREQIKAQGV